MWHSHPFGAFGILMDGGRPSVVIRRGTQLRTSFFGSFIRPPKHRRCRPSTPSAKGATAPGE
ncbi:MAG: hypothetical protein AAGG75_19295 [Bacteroidota bacterium]